MSNHPEVDDTVAAAFAAVRMILTSLDQADGAGGRHQVALLLEDLVKRHGQRALCTTGMLLAEIAANGMQNYAEQLGIPADQVLSQYQEVMSNDTDFELLIAEQFPEHRTDE